MGRLPKRSTVPAVVVLKSVPLTITLTFAIGSPVRASSTRPCRFADGFCAIDATMLTATTRMSFRAPEMFLLMFLSQICVYPRS